jgi:transcriptional regulator of aromatic amino acid metabolism
LILQKSDARKLEDFIKTVPCEFQRILFCKLHEDAVTFIQQYDYTGRVRNIKLPGVGTALVLAEENQTILYYSFTNCHAKFDL